MAEVTVVIATPGPAPPHASEWMRIAAEHAVAKIEAAGGVPGGPIKLVFEDGGCDAAGAREIARRAIAAGAAAIFGFPCAAGAEAAADALSKQPIDFIAIGRAPAATDTPNNLSRLQGFLGASQGAVAAEALLAMRPDPRIAVAHDRTRQSRAFVDEAIAQLRFSNIAPVAIESFSGGDKDYTALIERLRRAGIDALVLGAFPTEAALVVREIKQRDIDMHIVGSDTLAAQDFATRAGVARDGVLVILPYRHVERAVAPGLQAALGVEHAAGSSSRSRLRTTPFADRAAIVTHVALEAWAQAMRRAGSMPNAPAKARLADDVWQTISGPVLFRSGIGWLHEYEPYRWTPDGLVPLDGDPKFAPRPAP